MIRFLVHGHPNVMATHRNTLEFTKESHLSKKGDCILGVKAEYDLNELKKLKENIVITIKVNDMKDSLRCIINPDFNDNHEIVIRKTGFSSERTLGLWADKAAINIRRDIVDALKNPESYAIITIKNETKAKEQ